jgi:hypothetical protein
VLFLLALVLALRLTAASAGPGDAALPHPDPAVVSV